MFKLDIYRNGKNEKSQKYEYYYKAYKNLEKYLELEEQNGCAFTISNYYPILSDDIKSIVGIRYEYVCDNGYGIVAKIYNI